MELWRVSISRGLLGLVLFRMADGKEWCAPELSDGEQPLKCKKLVLLASYNGGSAAVQCRSPGRPPCPSRTSCTC